MAIDYKSSLVRYRRYLLTIQRKPLWGASLFLVLSLLLVVILLVAALRPTMITIATLFGQIKQGEKLETRMDNKIRVLDQARQEYQKYETDVQILEQAIPSVVGWDNWADYVMSSASSSGVAVKTLSFGEETSGTKFVGDTPGITFTLTAAGEYEQLKSFIASLGKAKRLSKISDMIMAPANNPDYALSLNGIIGYLK